MSGRTASTSDERTLRGGLTQLAEALREPLFSLSGAARGERVALRDRLVQDVEGHRTRLDDLDAPLLVVLGGVTGAGKSTVANTFVGAPLLRTGVLRPTTSIPTLLAHPDELEEFRGARVLGELARLESEAGTPPTASSSSLWLMATSALPQGLALVDAPDVDSVAVAHRDLADLLLDAADVWVWFTTAGKYADEESMRYLRRASRRRTALAVAITQVRETDRAEIVADFAGKLAAAGLPDLDIHVVPFAPVNDQQVPVSAVATLREWLWSLAEPRARRVHRLQTLWGAVAALPDEVEPLLGALDDELGTAHRLMTVAEEASVDARREFSRALDEGLPLQQEVLARWNRVVGTGRFLALAEGAAGQARSWIRDLMGSTASAEERRVEREVRVEVSDTVVDLVTRLGDLAAAQVAEGWSRESPGQALLSARPDLATKDPGLVAESAAEIEAWQRHVVELVAPRGAERKVRARWLSTLINAAATGAIVIALAQTGGLTGAEAGIATAAGAANQTLLVKLLGAANLRWLVSASRSDLQARFDRLMDAERRRYVRAVAEAAPEPDEVDAVREALTALGVGEASEHGPVAPQRGRT
ncbi:MAG: dynamin family protein [Egibacteraceae bacterium]